MDYCNLASLGLTLLSMTGAGISWWRSNLSKKARDEAETAKRRAEETLETLKRRLEEAEKQTKHLERLADAHEKPVLTVRHMNNDQFALCNQSKQEITVTGIVDEDDSLPLMRLEFPFTLPTGGHKTFIMRAVWGCPIPAALPLKIEGFDAPVQVPLAS
ncbi:hypothetical protein ACUH97_00590 [Dermabacteraceae bacterium P13088]